MRPHQERDLDKTCKKIDECPKIRMILDKDLAFNQQYAEAIRRVCARCSEYEEGSDGMERA